MTAEALHDVLEATGYLANGRPAHGVCLGNEAGGGHRAQDFVPDAWWRGESALTVYFKHKQNTPSDDEVAGWRRAIWNKGFAPLLWVVSPDKIDIYNGFGRPKLVGDAAAHRLRTFERIEGDLDRLDAFAGRLAMETGEFWRQAPRVNRRTSVDRQLLSDLAALERDLTKKNLDRPSAQGLIGRSIFAQYLIDRGIVTNELLESNYGHGTLAAILRDRAATEQLFDWLRRTFNGDMFPSQGSALPGAEYLLRVADFLDAVDPESGQQTLFPYQFDVIPVELISSIYEQFTHSDPSSKSTGLETDVFYTRLSLVSLVLDEITEGLTGEETVLDLSCGSGVFLVEALRKLVELRSGANKRSRETIRSTLHRQIYGVDISEPAVRVAAFSLYLAALELDPEPRPPEALRFEPLIGNTLIIDDARNVERIPGGRTALAEQDNLRTFDLIVGNPPWSYPGRSVRAARRSGNNRNDIRSPRGVSLDFVNNAMRFASSETRFGLVLSAIQFFGRSGTGAATVRQLIENLSPITLVNLSYQSGWLFSRGNLPAVVLLARHRPSDDTEITAVQVPWSPVGARTHTFEISRDDIVTLPLADWRRKPEFLKAAFFGSRRDLALLDKLTTDHASLVDRLSEFDTKLRAGLKLGNQSRDSRFLHGLPLLTKADLRSSSVPDDLALYDGEEAERPRNRDTYRAPLLLIREFLNSDGRPIAAMSNRDVVFTDAFFGAALPADRTGMGGIIAAILNSSLASWFFLMTASTFGLWMRRVLLRDIEYMPIPDLGTLSTTEASRRLAGFAQELQTSPTEDNRWRELDEAVFDLYKLDNADRVVVRDGLFRATWQWKAGRILSTDAAEIEPHVLAYAKTFLTTVDAWLSAANRRHMRGEVFDLPKFAPLRVVRFVIEEGPGPSVTRVTQLQGSLRDILDRIGERLDVQLGTSLVGQRAVRVYGPDEVVIIKPAARRHWMGVTALEDADAVIADSISGIAE